MEPPEVRYARSGQTAIAYQLIGSGAVDLIWVPGLISNIEFAWTDPSLANFMARVGSFTRLVRFDKRGTGLSDRATEMPTLETRMDDVRAVMDAVSSNRAVLLGMEEGGSMAILFAATYPERTSGLILYSSYARSLWAPDYPWGRQFDDAYREAEDQARRWGTTEYAREWLTRLAPDDQDASFRNWWASYMRFGASPSAAAALTRMNMAIDVRPALPAIRVPTLILHRRGRPDFQQGRYLAEHIPGARFIELDGTEQFAFRADSESILHEIERFVAEVGEPVEHDRILATVLFTDIVGSSERAAAIGDRAWKELLVNHHILVRRLIARFRGVEMDVAGDGFFARFDGPERAIHCACEIVNEMKSLDLQVRAGLHTGQCELIDGKAGGIAVHIGSRIASQALPGEILVSSTVKDLVVGSRIRFRDRGRPNLKGIPGEWAIYSVEADET